MMWTTCLRDGTIVFGAIESTIATGPSNCTSASIAELLAQLAPQRLDQRLAARRHRRRAAASTPCPASPAGRAARALASGGSQLTRIRGSISAATIRSRLRRARSSGSSSTSTSSTGGTCRITSCAIRMPGSTTNGSRVVVVDEVDEQLAAVARVDEARRVDDRDAVLRREPRARLHVARVPVRDRDREPGRHERTRARRELDALAGREVDARRRRRTRAPARRRLSRSLLDLAA